MPTIPFRKAAQKTSPFSLGPFGRKEDTRGIRGTQWYYTLRMPAPNVSPMQRQSLAQPILRHFHGQSTYKLMQPYNRFAPGYPYFKGTAQVPTSTKPSVRPTPVTARASRLNTPATAQPGTMGPQKRFGKALPLPINDYQPPVY